MAEKSIRAKAGHQEILGETIAKFELFRNGWNPYSRFLDHERIDLVARKNTGTAILYVDIQVKKVTLFKVGETWAKDLIDVVAWRFMKPNAFDDCNPNLAVALVLVHGENQDAITDYDGDLFIFRVDEFADLLKQAVPSKDQVKIYLGRSVSEPSRWFWCRSWKKGMTLSEEHAIEVSRYRQGFEALHDIAFRHEFVKDDHDAGNQGT